MDLIAYIFGKEKIVQSQLLNPDMRYNLDKIAFDYMDRVDDSIIKMLILIRYGESIDEKIMSTNMSNAVVKCVDVNWEVFSDEYRSYFEPDRSTIKRFPHGIRVTFNDIKRINT